MFTHLLIVEDFLHETVLSWRALPSRLVPMEPAKADHELMFCSNRYSRRQIR